MRKLLSKWKSSLKWKLIIVCMAIVFFNLAVVGYFVHQQVSSAIEQDAMESSGLVLKQANLYLSEYLDEIEKFMFSLGMSQELFSWSTLAGERKAESIVPYSMIQKDYIHPFARGHPELLSISMYSTRGNEVHFSPHYGLNFHYRLREESWFSEVAPAGKTTYLVTMSDNYVNDTFQPVPMQVITMVKKFGFNGAIYVKVDIQTTLLQTILNEINLDGHVTGFIVNADGEIIAHPQEASFLSKLDRAIMARMNLSPSGAFVKPDRKEIVVYERIADSDWKSVITLPYSEVTMSIVKIRDVVILTATSCLLVSALFIVLISSSITNRLNRIKRSMKHVGQGNIDATLPVEGQDEISILERSYNHMLDDLQLHIKRLSESELAEKHAVLFSLQSQIDSHFLYNTLEIINSMATRIRHYDIEQITVSLARMLRYSANYRDTGVTVRQEVQHMLSYLQIVKIRYGDLFTYDIQTEEACMEVNCIKVILQPIVENAVKHGYESTGEPFHISVHIQLEAGKCVSILVKDNGKGFSEPQLRELEQQMRNGDLHYTDFQRIGLLNIQYRLKVHYDSVFAEIQARNGPDGGAEVVLRFPLSK